MKCVFSFCLSILLGLGLSSVSLAQSSKIDFTPDEADSVIAQRLAVLDAKTRVSLPFNKETRHYIDHFTMRQRGFSRRMLKRQKMYFPIFEKYLAEYGLPEELKYLSIVESGLDPTAKSHAGAMGLWQFMPATGRMFGLRQDYYIDQRMDIEASTEAACKYLKQLYGMFGDWQLALASYNCGPGNVRRAIKRSGYKETFWEIYDYLPRETRNYVPLFVGAVYTMNYAEEHNLFVDDKEVMHPLAYDTLVVNQYVNLDVLCEQLGVCKDHMMLLNPQIKQGAVPEHWNEFVLRLPAQHREAFDTRRVAILDSAKQKGSETLSYDRTAVASGTTTSGKDRLVYRVRSGDVLGSIAGRYGVRVSDLRAWNGLSGDMIRIGQTLVIYTKPSAYTPKTTTASNTSKPNPTGQAIPSSNTHTVQPGDTLWGISQRYKGMTVERLKQLNGLKDNNLKPGQVLKLG